jgi:hypothetical protein
MFMKLLAIFFLLIVAPNAFSQSPDVQTLTELPGVAVAFQKYPWQLEQDGLSAKEVAIEAELRLRKALSRF